MTPFLSFLADVAVRSSLVLGAAFLILAFMRRASASERHLVLLLTLVVVALTPAGVLLSPKLIWTYDVPAQAEPAAPIPPSVMPESAMAQDSAVPQSSTEIVSPASAKWNLADGIGLLLTAGMAAQILLLARAVRAWRKIRRNAVRANLSDAALSRARIFAGKRGVPPILASDKIAVPLLAGWRRPAIILPTQADAWPVSRLAMVLCHEIAHFLRGDTLLLPFGALMRILFWWHPLVWLALARLRRERENACDDLVLAQNFRATDYAELIVETARQARTDSAWPATALAMASSANFSDRIRSILDPAIRRRAAGRETILTGIALAVVLGWPLVATQIQAQEKTPAPDKVPAPMAAPPQPGAESRRMVKVVAHFLEISEDDYAKDSATYDQMVRKGDLQAFQETPGVTLAGTPYIVTREKEQAVMESVRTMPILDPTTKHYRKYELGYRIVLTASIRDYGGIDINSYPEVSEYQGMTKKDGVEQPVFSSRMTNLILNCEDGKTKGFWLGDGFHLTELMHSLEKPVKSLDQEGLLPLLSKGPPKRLAIFFTVSEDKEEGPAVHAKLEEKVQNTLIDKIEFRNARIEEVLLYLQAETKRTDPEHIGVPFEIGHVPPPGTTITLKMEHVPLKIVLDEIATQARTTYVVENDINFGPVDPDPVGETHVETFTHLPQGFFGPFHPGPVDPKTGDFVNDAKPVLEAMGVKFPGDADAKHLTSLSDDALVVKNNEDELNKIRHLLANYVPTISTILATVHIVKIEDDLYRKEADAMDEAVAKGDLAFFQKRDKVARSGQVYLRVGQAAWLSFGEIRQYTASATRKTTYGKPHTVLDENSIFLGLHINFTSMPNSFPGKGPTLITSTLQLTDLVGADKLKLPSDIPPGDIPDTMKPLLIPLTDVSTWQEKDWEPDTGKNLGHWLGGIHNFESIDHSPTLVDVDSGKVPKMPYRLAVFLSAKMVKVPITPPTPPAHP